jgi:hypothetical protein
MTQNPTPQRNYKALEANSTTALGCLAQSIIAILKNSIKGFGGFSKIHFLASSMSKQPEFLLERIWSKIRGPFW